MKSPFSNLKKELIAICKISLLVAITALSFQQIQAQGFIKTYGVDSLDEKGKSLFQTSDGGFLISGYSVVNDSTWNLHMVKTDPDGEEEWFKVYPQFDGHGRDAMEDDDGNFLIIGSRFFDGTKAKMVVIKADPQGEVIWSKEFDQSNVTDPASGGFSLIQHSNGNYVFCGGITYEDNGASSDTWTFMTDKDGNILWQQYYGLDLNLEDVYVDNGVSLEEASNGDIWCLGYGIGPASYLLNYSPQGVFQSVERIHADPTVTSLPVAVRENDNNEVWVVEYATQGNVWSGFLTKYNNMGDTIFQKTIDGMFSGSDAQVTADGGIVVLLENPLPGSIQDAAAVVKFDKDGNEVWRNNYPIFQAGGLQVLQSGEIAISGSNSPDHQVVLIKMQSNGFIYNNFIEGTVRWDQEDDCSIDSTDVPVEQWVVQASGALDTFYTLTSPTGHYSFNLDTGTYIVNVFPISPYWSSCQAYTIQLGGDTTVQQDIAVIPYIDCPYLTVNIGTPLLRRCFDNIYTVNYCNNGTIDADSAYVDVTLDPFMTLNDASLPYMVLPNGLLRFELGTIDVGACSSFTIDVYLDCDSTVIGQTHCVAAHIYPDSLCIDSTNWDGSSIELTAACTGDSIKFNIKNVGMSSMMMPGSFFIVEDDLILFTGGFSLEAGMDTIVGVPSTGATYFMFASQSAGHPGNSHPTAFVEGCTVGGNPTSWGFINQFPMDDDDPFVDVDCQENRGAYDPNDKAGYPFGVSDQHYIDVGQRLEYKIRFQNTGTDTAFNILVIDTLPSEVDPLSMRMQGSSHSYSVSMEETGILKFYFRNIELVDSFTNEALSHGFLKFTIDQKRNVQVGDVIRNEAAIYFDFNEPIITNETWHTIGVNYLDVKVAVDDPIGGYEAIKVYPNPTQDQATFEMPIEGTIQFELFNLAGQKIRMETFEGDKYSFKRNNLTTGFYVFRFSSAEGFIGSGKIIVE